MSGVAAEWLNLLFRWGHIIVGVSWIGTSFYFIALDLGLRKRAAMKEGVYGTAWQVHGGGFYHVEKYLVAPTDLPSELIWFRWEAYLTWITGFALLVLQYYLQADAYLIDPDVADLSPALAIIISVVSLVAGWFVYDRLLCRTAIGERPLTLAVAVFLLVVLGALVFQFVFSGRGALIHVGALIGTIMAANVFLVIIPNQRKIAKSLLAGEPPDPALGAMSKQRSVHNNYLTLPVLLFMVSNHYPLLATHGQIWLVVALILVMGGSVRHLINRHDAHDPVRKFIWALPVAIAALAAAVVVTAPRTTAAPAGLVVGDAEALVIATERCAGCHSASPTLMGLAAPPRGIELSTLADLVRHAAAVRRQSVDTTAMPPGNLTDMTADERIRLGAWLEAPAMTAAVALSLDTVNALSEADFLAAFGDVAEHSPWVAASAAAARPFASREALVAAFVAAIDAADPQDQLALLRAHPDLAGRAAIAGELAPESTREQAAAGLGRLTPDEFARFTELNDRYRARFRFPFILAVRGATKDVILAAFAERVDGAPHLEFATALEQVRRIVRFRLEDRVAT